MTKIIIFIVLLFSLKVKSQTYDIDTLGLPLESGILKKIYTLINKNSKCDTTLFIAIENYGKFDKYILKGSDSGKDLLICYHKQYPRDSSIVFEINADKIFDFISSCDFSKIIYKRQKSKTRKQICRNCRIWLNPLDYSQQVSIIYHSRKYDLELDPWYDFPMNKSEEKLFYIIQEHIWKNGCFN